MPPKITYLPTLFLGRAVVIVTGNKQFFRPKNLSNLVCFITSETPKVVQRCRFATSEFREKVLWALDLRNRFAERPYLCADLIPREEILVRLV